MAAQASLPVSLAAFSQELVELPNMTNQQTHTVTPAAWAREQLQLEQPDVALAS